MKKIFPILTLLCAAFLTKAEDIVAFEFSGLAGNEVTAQSTSNSPALLASVISRGAGLVATANGQRFNANNWNTNDLADAILNNDYMEFSVTNIGTNAFSITNIIILSQRSNTGPTNLALRGSHDGFASDLGTYVLNAGTVTATNSIDVSAVAALQNRNTPITFRLYGFSAGGLTGTFGIGDSTTPTDNDLIIQGSTDLIVVIPTAVTNIVTIAATENASELGTNGVFTLSSTGTNFPITVTYTLGGTATFTNDYDFLPPATSNSIVMSTSTTNIDIVPVNDGDTNEINPEDVIITLDAGGAGWEAGSPNSATVQIFETVISNQPPSLTNVNLLTGFDLILKAGFKPGKTVKWKSAKGVAPLKGPKGQITSTNSTVSSVAYALVPAGTNTNAITFITAGKVKPIIKGALFKKNVRATFKATKTTKVGIGIPAGTTSASLIVRVGGTTGTNTGFEYFTNTYTTVVK